MIKLEIEDFIFEVREELVCYDEIGTSGADEWERGFRSWLGTDKAKKSIAEQKGKKYFKLKDESEIFDIADEYLEAMETKNIENYWKTFGKSRC